VTLKEQFVDDVVALFLDEDTMAESVTYEGSAILAVVDKGVGTRDGTDGNGMTSDGTSSWADIAVSAEDVPTPKRNDSVTDESGKVWTVVYVKSSDEGMHVLVCTADENPFA
jgi:hypothetical protein